jgi:hypothetical protein
MGLTVRRIGVAAASAQIVVEYDEHVASKTTNGSVNSRRHQVVSLTQEAMGMVRGTAYWVAESDANAAARDGLRRGPRRGAADERTLASAPLALTPPLPPSARQPAPSLAASLRQSLPQLFPSYVGDDVLVPLLLQMLQPRPPQSSSSSSSSSTLSATPAPTAPAIPSVIATIGDLQRVGPAALQAAKSRMDVVFEANRVRPGEEGFRYDVRVDFPAQAAGAVDEPNEWDDE